MHFHTPPLCFAVNWWVRLPTAMCTNNEFLLRNLQAGPNKVPLAQRVMLEITIFM